MSQKKYESKDWLTLRHTIQNRTPEQIAEECGVNPITIYRWLWRYQILKRKPQQPKAYGKLGGKFIRDVDELYKPRKEDK